MNQCQDSDNIRKEHIKPTIMSKVLFALTCSISSNYTLEENIKISNHNIQIYRNELLKQCQIKKT